MIRPLVLALGVALGAQVNTASADAGVHAIESIGITVGGLDTALDFYTKVLPFKLIDVRSVKGSAGEHLYGVFGMHAQVARLQLGEETIELIDYLAPEGRPVPVDSRSNDHWFQHVAIIVRDMDEAYAHLRQHGITHASPSPQRLPDWNPNAGGIEAFYFKDPDGNHLEILAFPEDKGDPRWHQDTDELFLGIDHTAIVVADTDLALRFYRDTLGLEVRGTSENYGIEQERLNNVFGARLRITALRAAEGPAIEFLEYLAPSTGRPMPVDTQANDLWHWQIQMRGDYQNDWLRNLVEAGGALVSPGSVPAIPGSDAVEAVHFRGPTGHALILRKE